MFAKDLTFFDLAGTSTHLVAAGGGGSTDYGKRNGILIAKKGELDAQSAVFYETEDIIRHVRVYREREGYEDFPTDEYSDEDGEASLEEPHAGPAMANQKVSASEFFIAAAGLSFFYLLKFTGKVTLLKKIRFAVEELYLTRHLLILHSGTLSGFYNAIINPRVIQVQQKQNSFLDANEEYFYRLFRKGNEIVYKRECGTQDIPANWSNFYLHEQRVYKILFDSGKSSFVFDNKRYSYEGRIPRIFMNNGMLSFYVVQEKGSMLVFIRDTEMAYKLPKITCLTAEGPNVAAATCNGDIILYRNGIFRSKTYASPIPITGLVLDGAVVYYSTLMGELSCCSVSPSRVMLWFLIALLLIVLSAGVKYWMG